MYALALKGKTSPKLLTTFSSSLTPQGNRRDKPIIEYDPEIEKTLTRNQNRVKLKELFSENNKKQIPTKVLLKNFLKKK
ncbi:hypothetical protein PIB30_091102 [Stylosanthes scabra]|uniref:Uncharacterized protein n=1 Tax=Stylosanthes scabra TaxID=79078 RepID=A0ABU6WU73_9FABA|nr:hypothetical protein [Stylosanthes scabra]